MSTCVATSVDVALLGCGNVGSALVRLAASEVTAALPFSITSALVRDTSRVRNLPVSPPFSADPRSLLASHPDVVVELLGGIEPARTLVLDALERGIPVVTANKTLLARHGVELRTAARVSGTPLLYEASVLAGVPFLGTFARRPQAASASALLGIANGTSNFILTRCAEDGVTIEQALAEAQRRGYAEPDPRNDITGVDASEKLAVLLQHFASLDVHPDSIERHGIDSIAPIQTIHARELGGVIKPVIHADWTDRLDAFVGPAFVPGTHALAHVDGVENALLLRTAFGRLHFQGPGAGADVTAATVLDDVREIAEGQAARITGELTPERPREPVTEWLVTFGGERLPRATDIADLLASHGLYSHRATIRRSAGGREQQSLLVLPASRAHVELGLRALRAAAGCEASALRALGVAS